MAEKLGGGQSAGVEVALVHIQPHASQLLLELLGGAAAGIGQEEKLLIFAVEPVHEFLYAGKQTVSVVDDTVHITDETLFVSELLHIDLLCCDIDTAPLYHRRFQLSTVACLEQKNGRSEKKAGRLVLLLRVRVGRRILGSLFVAAASGPLETEQEPAAPGGQEGEKNKERACA